jgi:hypothetical protein
MQLIGANPTAQVEGLEELPGKANYFLGNDPKKWRTDVSTYGKVKYHDVYPGIDLLYYGRQQQLEYDLVLSHGADPRSIRLSFEGADKLEVDPQGNLVLHTASGELVQHAPHIYQEVGNRKRTIPGRYILVQSQHSELSTDHLPGIPQQVAFQMDGYDPHRALVIDPVLVYSTYLGGSGNDGGSSIAVDITGNAYFTGGTGSIDFPTANAFQPALGAGGIAGGDAFVGKLNAAGSALVYSTYLGGSGGEGGSGIAVDTAGNAYLTGLTSSPDFPTANPLQPGLGGGDDAFVTKLNASGSALVYSTFLGGSDDESGNGIAVDPGGNAYVTGVTGSNDFPTANPLQPVFAASNGCGDQRPFPCPDGFVAKLNPAGGTLVYATFLRGHSADSGDGIVVDTIGNAYLTGQTSSPDFPTANALQQRYNGGDSFFGDAFVAKLNAAGTALVYSTYLGGSGAELGSGIAVDSAGNAYLTGLTISPDFPTANPLGGDAFVTKLNPAGSALVYSTFLGGSSYDSGSGIAVDSAGNSYVIGQTYSPDFPTANPLQPRFGGGDCGVVLPCPDAFVAKLNAAGTALVYSTFLGGSGGGAFDVSGHGDRGFGIAVDSAANAYVTGRTDSPDFPTVKPLQASHGGAVDDIFVAKIANGPSAVRIEIDTKPGGFPNSINPYSNGNIPVAILTTDSFDATSVNPSTIRFGRTGKEAAPLRSSREDVDEDRDSDLLLHFATQQTGLLCGDTRVWLTGKTIDGQAIKGSDSVRTVGCHEHEGGNGNYHKGTSGTSRPSLAKWKMRQATTRSRARQVSMRSAVPNCRSSILHPLLRVR